MLQRIALKEKHSMHFVSDEITHYCEQVSTVPSGTCQEIEKFTKANVPMAIMLAGPLVGSFLGFLVSSLKAKRILEIGSFTGYSSLAMAERLPENGELFALDVDQESQKVAQSFWDKSPHGKKIQSLIGPASQSLAQLTGPFDLIFIDADKISYPQYVEKSLALLSDDGVIVVDNCLYGGDVLADNPSEPNPRSIRQMTEWVHEHPNLESTLLPVRDGLLMIRKKSVAS